MFLVITLAKPFSIPNTIREIIKCPNQNLTTQDKVIQNVHYQTYNYTLITAVNKKQNKAYSLPFLLKSRSIAKQNKAMNTMILTGTTAFSLYPSFSVRFSLRQSFFLFLFPVFVFLSASFSFSTSQTNCSSSLSSSLFLSRF